MIMKNIYTMTKSILLTGGLLSLGAAMSFGQNVGIANDKTPPHPSAMLEVKATNKGLLIPRVDLTDKNDKVTIANPAATLLVYNIATNGSEFPQGPGYYYNANEKNDGDAVWVKLLDSQFTTPWLLGGNNDIDAAIHFVGSANDADVVFKRGGVEGVRLTRGGAMLATGSIDGATPAQGAGRRLMWIPAKAAFRAGEVIDANWDNANVGLRSFAGGYNTSASGEGSTAMGVGAMAFGYTSTAMGLETIAAGKYSTAMGYETTASGENSTAMGYGTIASGKFSTAMGIKTTASGDTSTAMGYNTVASGLISTAMGEITTASGWSSTAMGYNTTASGVTSTAIGFLTTASGLTSTAMGYQTIAYGAKSTAMGHKTTAEGLVSTAMGYGTTASGLISTAMGWYTTASGDRSTSMGVGTTASGDTSTAMGWLTTASGGVSTAMGWKTTASGKFSTAMGVKTTASGDTSTAMGSNTVASGERSTATGWKTTASGNQSTAMGHNTKAEGVTSTAMGFGTTASGLTSTAMGWQTTASGSRSTAMGEGTIAEAASSLAIGRYNLIQNLPPDPLPLPGDKVFQIGNGIAANIRSDAFFVLRNGNAELAGTLKENSDIRLKKDVLPLEKVMGKIAHIQPITYNFINTQTHPGEHQIGFNAQEVQKQFPELVSENEQGYLSVSYNHMSAVAIQAIKEQQEIIKKLEEKIAQLEKKMEKN
jgi:hypothetical protein